MARVLQPPRGARSLEVLQTVTAFMSLDSTGSLIRATSVHGSGFTIQAPVAGPSVLPTATGAYGGRGEAATGGFGLSFFGIAALLALSGLVVPRVVWTLRITARVAAPQPLVSLLERPG